MILIGRFGEYDIIECRSCDHQSQVQKGTIGLEKMICSKCGKTEKENSK